MRENKKPTEERPQPPKGDVDLLKCAVGLDYEKQYYHLQEDTARLLEENEQLRRALLNLALKI